MPQWEKDPTLRSGANWGRGEKQDAALADVSSEGAEGQWPERVVTHATILLQLLGNFTRRDLVLQ